MNRGHENFVDEPAWPVDLDQVRLWPMESEDGPLLRVTRDEV